MIKQYFKQAWRILRENPILSFITILGTALSICMIMMQVMTDEVKYGNLTPESNRDRMLFIRSARISDKNNLFTQMGLRLVRELCVPMQTPEKVAFSTSEQMMIRKPGVNEGKSIYTKMVNEDYWDCFDHQFLYGSPFTKADVKAGAKKVVVRDTWAKEFFETDDAVGKTILIEDIEYTICGVVASMSSLTYRANGNFWIPYTAHQLDDGTDLGGTFEVMLLAKSSKDFTAIIKEFNQRVEERNANDPFTNVTFGGQPDTYYVSSFRNADNMEPDMKNVRTRKLKDYALFLLIPAINLALMTSSRMMQRRHEIGIRRAYGSTVAQAIRQVLWESLLFTIIGAILGFLLSLGGVFALSEILFNGYSMSSLRLTVWDYLQPRVFLYAIVFCLFLNFISSIIPAVRFSKSDIVNNLK